MVLHSCPNTQEAEKSQVQGWLEQHSELKASLGDTVESNQLGLHSKVQASLGYVVRL